MLKEIDDKAQEMSSAVYYAWINATCHEEVFSYFDVEPTSLPTVVFLHTGHNIYSTLIGTFDKDTIESYDQQFRNERLPKQKVKVEKR